ncbi:MAG: hypothetical protein QGG42_08815 [Phycisphaerae bacterium]|jgi:hypothetical protein|nr:hypothetical protein [Phycisphaerae bacterium]
MPIIFTVHPDDGYYTAKYIGVVTDTGMMEDFRSFLSSGDWYPGLNELADLSEADVSAVTMPGIKNLSALIAGILQEHNFSPRVAVYAPRDLPYGLARVYSVHAETFETHCVFRDITEAREWLDYTDDDYEA